MEDCPGNEKFDQMSLEKMSRKTIFQVSAPFLVFHNIVSGI